LTAWSRYFDSSKHSLWKATANYVPNFGMPKKNTFLSVFITSGIYKYYLKFEIISSGQSSILLIYISSTQIGDS